MYCILPFEKDFYANLGLSVSYFGHPLLDEIRLFNDVSNEVVLSDKKIIALLPGSRKQEIERKLPIMIESCSTYPEYSCFVACASNLDISFYDKYKAENIVFVQNATYSLLQKADLAIVASGTATLETALFKVPQIVCYKTSKMSYYIAKVLVKIKYISLVNLILNKKAVVELIQDECNTINIVKELNKIISDKDERDRIQTCYNELIYLLKEEGASERIAHDMLKWF